MTFTNSVIFPFFFVMFILGTGACDSPTDTNTDNSRDDLSSLKNEIEARDATFAEYFNVGDSVGLASLYTTDGALGSVSGRDNLRSAWSGMIMNARENGHPNVKFITNGISTDGELVAELGMYQYMNSDSEVKSSGKYLVIWKKEDGEWKIYRDWGL